MAALGQQRAENFYGQQQWRRADGEWAAIGTWLQDSGLGSCLDDFAGRRRQMTSGQADGLGQRWRWWLKPQS